MILILTKTKQYKQWYIYKNGVLCEIFADRNILECI